MVWFLLSSLFLCEFGHTFLSLLSLLSLFVQDSIADNHCRLFQDLPQLISAFISVLVPVHTGVVLTSCIHCIKCFKCFTSAPQMDQKPAFFNEHFKVENGLLNLIVFDQGKGFVGCFELQFNTKLLRSKQLQEDCVFVFESRVIQNQLLSQCLCCNGTQCLTNYETVMYGQPQEKVQAVKVHPFQIEYIPVPLLLFL